MSNPPSTGDQHGDPSRDEPSTEEITFEAETPTFAKPIRKAGFWGAIVLPVLYVPILVHGLSNLFWVVLFVGLIAVNLAALYVGHAHRR